VGVEARAPPQGRLCDARPAAGANRVALSAAAGVPSRT
jgi:hypothetical protein